MHKTPYFLAICMLLISCDKSSDEHPVVRVAYVIFPAAIRSKANDASTLLAGLAAHDKVEVTNHTEGGWTAVRFGAGHEYGFVETRTITPSHFVRPAKIKGSKVILRENPSKYHPAVKTLTPTDSVDHWDDFDAEWARVCLKDGTWGFVPANELIHKDK